MKYLNSLLIIITCLSNVQGQTSAIFQQTHMQLQQALSRYQQQAPGQAQFQLERYLKQNQDPNLAQDLAELHLALSLLKQNDPQGPTLLQNFIRKHDPNALATQARLEAGQYYFAQKQFDQTIEYLANIQTLDLPNQELSKIRFQLAYSYFSKNQKAKAKPLFQQVRSNSQSPYYHAANYYFGFLCFEEKQYPQALEAFEIAEKSPQYSKIIPSYRCKILFAQNQFQALIAYAQPLLNQNNNLEDRPSIALLLGQAYFQNKAFSQALPQLEYYVQSQTKVSEQVLYQLAYTQYKSKQYDKALQTFNQLNTLNSALGQNALYNMADCYLKTDNKTAARQAFQRAAQMNFELETTEEARFQYAKLSYELGFDNDAITALQATPSSSPNYRQSQELLSQIFLNTRDYEKALQYLRAMNNKTPQLKETHQKVAYARGAQLYRENQIPRATRLLDTALTLYVHAETRALCFFWLGEAYYLQKDYDKSISHHNQFQALCSDKRLVQSLPDNSSPGTSSYALGYAYLKQDRHVDALRHFNQCLDYIEKNRSKIRDLHVLNFVYPDALLRAADCHLYLNRDGQDRRKARQLYQIAISNNFPNQDYALYQQSLIASLENQLSEQIRLIDQLLTLFPQSQLADEALFAKGSALLNNRQAAAAQTAFTQLIKNYPNSVWKNRARLKMAVALIADNRPNEAIDYYKAVLIDQPSPEDARDALAGVREIYVETGNINDYYRFIESLGYNVNQTERDSTLFRTALRSYEQRNLQVALQHFNTYLQNFPQGLHSLRARFLRGETLFDLKQFDQALPDYAFVSDKAPNQDAEIAHYRAAIISYYHSKNFQDALRYYTRLEGVASSDALRFEARLFRARSAFFAQDFTALQNAAQRLLQEPRATNAEKAEAHYYLGKFHQQQKQINPARDNYRKTVELGGDDVRAAEARYQIARLYYEERNLDKALDLCFQTNKEIPNHMFWLVKSFVLMADIYAEKGNLFQAKATLESILQNYNGDQELVNEVKRKLENVKQREAQKSKL